MKKTIDNYLTEHEHEMIQALSAAIAVPSVKDPATASSRAPFGREVGRALELMLRTAEARQFTTENMENYVGRVRWGGDGIQYAVLTHVDVVPEGTGWTVPPFAGTVKDGRLYGRGSTDDKGPGVASIFALAAARAALQAQHIEPRNSIMLLFGTDEESGWGDFDYYFKKYGVPEAGFSPDAEFPIVNGEKGILNLQLVGHGTRGGILRRLEGGTRSNVVPEHAEALLVADREKLQRLKGLIERLPREDFSVNTTLDESGLAVAVEGAAAHASTPEKGRNAIGKLLEVLDAVHCLEDDQSLQFLARDIGTEWTGHRIGVDFADEISGPLTLNLGTLHVDHDDSTAVINIRYPIKVTSKQVTDQFVDKLLGTRVEFTVVSDSVPHYVDPGTPLIQTLQKAYTEYTGTEARCFSIGGGTYARAIPGAVAFGPLFPGQPMTEHGPDEYIDIASLLKATRIYAYAMAELLKG
ncbi:MAG: dipeptidase PepV [Candidatus Cryosericum sp.]|nr:dipeptidase PepV [Candidatus Cryosericum sp.]HPS69787.1 dipeptidase PepV [Candidatus Cryosericum sp.]